MKALKFSIDLYDWDVVYVEVESKNDASKVKKKLAKLGIPKKMRKRIVTEVIDGSTNGGDHMYILGKRWSVLVIGITNTKGNKMETIMHEKRHLEDTILDHLRIDDKESAAFLAGFIAKKLSPIIK